MRTIIFTLILYLFFTCDCYAQNPNRNVASDKLPSKPIQLNEEDQGKKVIQFIIQYYGKAFRYYRELLSGNYSIIKNTAKGETRYKLEIYSDSRKNKTLVQLKLKNISFGNKNQELTFDKEEIRAYINLNEPGFTQNKNSSEIPVTIVDRDKILFDQMILKYDEIPQEHWRILDRTVTEFLDDQNGDPFALYRLLQAGVVIPYQYGTKAKLLTLDNQYHSIIYFDSEVNLSNGDHPINQVFGYKGLGRGEFMNPTGITLGRSYYSGDYLCYPVYIADQYNFRVASVNYWMQENTNEIGYFDGNSFDAFYGVSFPYDVAFARGRYLDTPAESDNSDKLWVSEAHPYTPFLSCYSEFGNLKQRFSGYYDDNTGVFYSFLPGTLSRLAVFYGDVRILSFIDNIRNRLISCELDGYGKASYVLNNDIFYIKANDILLFPENERINSVKFQVTTPTTWLYPYLWLTSENKIHCLKMQADLVNGFHTQYLASTSKPYNTDEFFSHLMNTISTNEYYEMATIESWSYERGLRRYLPFADVYDDTLFDYCNDRTDEMKLKAVFTNDCWLQFTAERRKNDGNWESVKIKRIIGQEINDYQATIYRIAGSTEIWSENPFTIQLELPASDYLIGGRIRLHMRITPDNQNPYATESDFVHKNYEINISRNCGPRAGGCPYIYVNNLDDDYAADNNILQRSEFQEYTGQDVLDRYKLNLKPLITNNFIQIAVAENENDNSMFDVAKLYCIDHPSETTVGITESNDIIAYNRSEVISTDLAFLNDGNNITSLIQYSTQLGTKGYVNDIINSHYPNSSGSPLDKNKVSKSTLLKSKGNNNLGNVNDNSVTKTTKKDRQLRQPNSSKVGPIESDSVAVIAYLGNLDTLVPVSRKTWAGNLFSASYSGEMNTRMFARRERLSEVIIPVFDIVASIETVSVNWLSDFNIKYLSTVPVHYNLYQVNEIPLQEANLISQNWQSNVTTQLLSTDQNYVNMDMNSYISLKFNAGSLPSIPEGYVRDYIFESVGQYTSVGKNLPLKVENQQVPLTNKLYNNYPNPFNPITMIKYDLERNSNVKITIYNILGQEVKVLINEFKKAGSYNVKFDATNLASGIYFYRIEAGIFVEAKKMVLIK